MRGQSFLENAIITGMVLGLVMTLFYFSSDFTLFHYRQQQADDALRSLLITANAVHELGPGNRQDVLVSIPEDVKISAQKKNLLATDTTGNVNTSLNTPYDVVGQIPASEGISKITVRSLNSTLVKVGKWIYLIQLDKPLVNVTSLPLLITIFGEDLDLATQLLVNNVYYPTLPFTLINSTTATLNALSSIFTTPSNQITTYQISLRDANGTSSQSLPFRVRGPSAP